MGEMYEKAKELGNALARTDEYRALRKAIDTADEDRELVELRNRIRELETEIETLMRAGREPDEDITKVYAELTEELQTKPGFQQTFAIFRNLAEFSLKSRVKKKNELLLLI